MCMLYLLYSYLGMYVTHRCKGAAPLNRLAGSIDGVLSTWAETNHERVSFSTIDAGSTDAHWFRSPGILKFLSPWLRLAQRSRTSAAVVALREAARLELAVTTRVHRRTARAVATMATRRKAVASCCNGCCLGLPLQDDGDRVGAGVVEEAEGVASKSKEGSVLAE